MHHAHTDDVYKWTSKQDVNELQNETESYSTDT